MIYGSKALRIEVKIEQREKRKLSKHVVSVETSFSQVAWRGQDLETLEQEAVSLLPRINHVRSQKFLKI